jgi:hypothetical protein
MFRSAVFAALLAAFFVVPAAAQFLEAVPPPDDPKLYGLRDYPPTSRIVLVPIAESPHAKAALAFLQSKPQSFTEAYVSDIVTEADGTELLMVLRNAPEECSPIGCMTHILQKVDGAWVRAAIVNGHIHYKHAIVAVLEAPIIGRLTIPFDGASFYGPPVTILPSYLGRRTFIDVDGGVAWDGQTWERFCWQRCDEG